MHHNPILYIEISKKNKKPILISVEGSIDSAFKACNLINSISKNYDYEIYGKVSKDLKKNFLIKNITFFGQVSRQNIKKNFKKK